MPFRGGIAGNHRIAIEIGVIHIKTAVLRVIRIKRQSQQPLFRSADVQLCANIQKSLFQRLSVRDPANPSVPLQHQKTAAAVVGVHKGGRFVQSRCHYLPGVPGRVWELCHRGRRRCGRLCRRHGLSGGRRWFWRRRSRRGLRTRSGTDGGGGRSMQDAGGRSGRRTGRQGRQADDRRRPNPQPGVIK